MKDRDLGFLKRAMKAVYARVVKWKSLEAYESDKLIQRVEKVTEKISPDAAVVHKRRRSEGEIELPPQKKRKLSSGEQAKADLDAMEIDGVKKASNKSLRDLRADAEFENIVIPIEVEDTAVKDTSNKSPRVSVADSMKENYVANANKGVSGPPYSPGKQKPKGGVVMGQ